MRLTAFGFALLALATASPAQNRVILNGIPTNLTLNLANTLVAPETADSFWP